MNLYEARYENAKRIAQQIKSYLDQGYIVRDREDSVITEITTESPINIKWEGTTYSTLFEYDKEWDHGYYTPIRKFNKYFEKWTIVHPKDIKKLELKK